MTQVSFEHLAERFDRISTIIDTHLYGQREKVEDARSIAIECRSALQAALAAQTQEPVRYEVRKVGTEEWIVCNDLQQVEDIKKWHSEAEWEIRPLYASPVAQAVKVKALEWQYLGGNVYRAFLPIIGSIRVEPYAGGMWQVLWSMPGQCDNLIPDVFETPEQAKAAAQAHFDQAILSALEIKP